MSMSWTSWNRKLWFPVWFCFDSWLSNFHVCLASKLGLTDEFIYCGHWIEIVKVRLLKQCWSPSISKWHSDFISWLLFESQFISTFTERNQCKSLHLAWALSLLWWPLIAKSGAERLRVNQSCTYNIYFKYVNYARHAIYIKYVPEPTLVTSDSS